LQSATGSAQAIGNANVKPKQNATVRSMSLSPSR